MALSEHERKMLAEIEQALIADDPRLSKRVAQHGRATDVSVTLRSVAIILLGLTILLAGMFFAQRSLWFVALSICGFFVMFAGGMMVFRTKVPQGKARGIFGDSAGAASRKKSKSFGGGFASKMEENFRKRFDG